MYTGMLHTETLTTIVNMIKKTVDVYKQEFCAFV